MRRGLWSDTAPALSGDVAWLGERAYNLDCHAEGRHFPTGEPELRWVGRRAVVAACSDIVAAGAVPESLTVGLHWPAQRTYDELTQLYEGIADACDELALRLTGGDWQSGPALSLSCAVSGFLPPGARALWPRGQAGDILVVSATLGDAWVGLHDAASAARTRYCYPRLDRAFASVAARSAAVHGMTDITDGLLREVALMAANSSLGASLDLGMLPRSAHWHSGTRLPQDEDQALDFVLGSDEYALLAAVAPDGLVDLRAEVEKTGHSVYAVGLLEQGNTLQCSGLIPPQASHVLSLDSLNRIARITRQAYAQS